MSVYYYDVRKYVDVRVAVDVRRGKMNQEIKSLALKQYLKYFAGWFIVAGILLVVTIGAFVLKILASGNNTHNNSEAPTERVYDYAEVLTEQEEADLRARIAKTEALGELDIVIVTLDMPMGSSDYEWENNMMNYADDFYDNGKFGWNMPYGDGVCLVDNWYEDEDGSQKGAWLSTAGKMIDTIGPNEEYAVMDAMYAYIDYSPYKAYCAAVDELGDYGKYGYDSQGGDPTWFCLAFIVPFIVALIYALINLSQSKAPNTTVAGTYVENGQMNVRSRSDQFIRKSVSSYRVSSSSGSSGGGGSSHRGGGSRGTHRSSSGRSHGGGGRRR